MKLVTEASLDIDKNRKVWLVSTATDVAVDEVEEVVASMAGALVDQITKANKIVSPALGGERMPPTFQED